MIAQRIALRGPLSRDFQGMIGAGLFNPQASVAYLSFRQDSPSDIPPVKASVPSSACGLWIMLLTLGTTFVKRQEARGSFYSSAWRRSSTLTGRRRGRSIRRLSSWRDLTLLFLIRSGLFQSDAQKNVACPLVQDVVS
jgi:hypothetical protein